MRVPLIRCAGVVAVAAWLGGCGGGDDPKAEPKPTPAPLTMPEDSPYCADWPEDEVYCGGTPMLSGEGAVNRAEASGVLNPKSRLVRLASPSFHRLAPDGNLVLDGDGWDLLFDRGDAYFELLEVGIDLPKPLDVHWQPQTYCKSEAIRPDGLSAQIQTASALVSARYGAGFAPGTFRIFVTREAACISSTQLSRTLVQFELQRGDDTDLWQPVTVEFDAAGELFGPCEDGHLGRGCRELR